MFSLLKITLTSFGYTPSFACCLVQFFEWFAQLSWAEKAPSIPLDQKGKKPCLEIDFVHDETSSESRSKGASIPLRATTQGKVSLFLGGSGSLWPVQQQILLALGVGEPIHLVSAPSNYLEEILK